MNSTQSVAAAAAFALASPIASAQGAQLERPAVIVRIENRAPDLGTFQTPVWVGMHDGTFDIYDTGSLASALPFDGSVALERLAEDGDNAAITTDFSTLVPTGPQGTVLSNGPAPPFAPGATAARLFEVDPAADRYFSYGSMVLPSNDAFVANASPVAHELFDSSGGFVGASFVVDGAQVRDAGTEANDEVPANTAFFGQATPDTGVITNDVIAVHPGFLPAGSGGILDDPAFMNGDFTAPGYQTLGFSFELIDRAARYFFSGEADSIQTVPPANTGATGLAFMRFDGRSDFVQVFAFVNDLTGPVTVAHLHVGQAGEAGAVVADLTPSVIQLGPNAAVIQTRVRAAALTGPVGDTGDPAGNFLAEAITDGIYLNVHTAAFPAGEVRAQLTR